MHSLRYAGDECNSEKNIKWLNELNKDGKYTQVAEFSVCREGGADRMEPGSGI